MSAAFSASDVAQFLEKYWYKKSGLAGAIVFSVFAVASVLALAKAWWPVTLGTPIVVSLLLYVFWRLSHRLPKTKKNHIGFVISIHCDDDAEMRRVRDDFIIPLRQLLRGSKAGQKFHFIVFPPHLASQINDLGDAEKIRAKTRAHFMLYGRVRERILDGNEHHIVDLDGIVSHKPIPENLRQYFSNEFTELLPKRVHIRKENDLLSFRFTSEWAGVVAEYIIGFAAAISGDLDYAEQLYRDALKNLDKQNKKFPTYARLIERIPIRISELYEIRARIAHQKWCNTREQKYVDDLGNYLDNVQDDNADAAVTSNLRAIYAFIRDRDVRAAMGFLKRFKGASKGSADSNSVGAWNYNMAFLNAYDGDLKTAIRHYRKAAMAIVEPGIIDQVESFLCYVLEEEPDKYQLHYCLGFFNWKTKGDTVQAEKDFRKFLSSRKPDEFVKEEDLIHGWLKSMKSENKR